MNSIVSILLLREEYDSDLQVCMENDHMIAFQRHNAIMLASAQSTQEVTSIPSVSHLSLVCFLRPSA